MKEIDLVIEYAKAWKKLDVSYLEDILADDFQYESQWVFDVMEGKDNYMDYLKGKFKTILQSPDSIPTVEVGYFPYAYGEQNKPCIVLTQREKKVSILIKTESGKVKRADMVGVPSAHTAVLFGDLDWED